MPKILVVVSQNNFQDQEYHEPLSILQNNGIQIETTSFKIGRAVSNQNKEVAIINDLNYFLKDEERIKNFTAIVFIGGSGMAPLVTEQKLIDLALMFYQQKKIIAAICIAPLILANAGILKNKRATVFPNQENIDLLINKGAEYDGDSIIVDDNVLTANGPKISYKFGLELAKLILNKHK